MLWYLAYLSLSVSYWLTFLVAIPAGGFLIRTFIIFHDCCHKSFFKNKKANDIIGTITGILSCFPYSQWKYEHSMHHATSGNLDKRGIGDIWTLTVTEYISLSWFKKMLYRVYRNPIVMFGLGPIGVFLIQQRFNRKKAGLKERMNTYLTNLSILAIVFTMCELIGWKSFLLVESPIFLISGATGIWLFYVQHTFEDTYFEHDEEWEYVQAAMHGSSYYKLPSVLRWMTGNIGFHHIHHLSPRVPNYNLEKAHNQIPILQKVQTITIKSSLQSIRFRFWDEEKKQFLGFKEIKKTLSERKR
jgi:omega-6 fatty acid desaturase (delta-12 desaturase)